MSVERRKIDSILELQRQKKEQELLKQALQKVIHNTKEIKIDEKETIKQQ